MSGESKFYNVSVPVDRPGAKRWWHRIGSATAFKSPQDGREGIAITLHSIPVNWNGECYLYSSDDERKKKEGKTP